MARKDARIRRLEEVIVELGVPDRFIARWKRRYLEGGVLRLADAPRPAGRTIG